MAKFKKCFKSSATHLRHLGRLGILLPFVILVMVASVFAQQPNNAAPIAPNHFSIKPTTTSDRTSPTNIGFAPQLKFKLITNGDNSEERFFDKKIDSKVPFNSAFQFQDSLRLTLENIVEIEFQKVKTIALQPLPRTQGDSEKSRAISGNAQAKKAGFQKVIDDTEIIPVLGSVVTYGESYKPMNGQQRYQLFLAQNFTTPHAYLKLLMPTLQNQLTNFSPEWGHGLPGLAERYLSYAVSKTA